MEDLRATVSVGQAIELNAQIVSAFIEIVQNGKSNSQAAVKTVDHFIDDLT